MTNKSTAPPLECGDLAGAVAALRERGLRLSTTRRLVLEALFAADGPVSAEHIARRLNLDLATVYRNLETLQIHGLTRHVHLGHGPGLYALLAQGEREYLFCDRCGAVRALTTRELDPIREHVRKRFGYEVSFTHFAIVGTCPACSTRQPPQGPSQAPPRADRPALHDQHRHDHDAHSHGDHIHSHPRPHRTGRKEQQP